MGGQPDEERDAETTNGAVSGTIAGSNRGWDTVTEPGQVLYVAAGGTERVATLESAGLPVVRATSAVDARKRLDDESIDCVVSDVTLPDADAVELVHAVRAVRSSVPVFLVGESDDPERVLRALAVGATDYFEDAGRELVDRVGAAVAQRRADRELDRHDRLKEAAREIAVDVADAASREAVEAAVHEHLSAAGLYRFAWVGGYDHDEGKVQLRRPSLRESTPEEIASLLGCDDPGFIERAATGDEVAVTDGSTEFRSAAAAPADAPSSAPSNPNPSVPLATVPFTHDATVYGIAILAGRRLSLDTSERAVLSGVGRVVGHALWSIEARAEASEANRAFAEQLAHELRNPLGIASSHLELGRETGDPESFDQVESALERIEGIVDGMSTLAGRDAIENARVRDIDEDASEAWESLSDPDADLVVDGGLEIEADHDLLVRLLSNLFRNATERDETTTVRVGPLGTEAADEAARRSDGGSETGFYVEDDGPGIPSEQRDAVFEWGFSTTDGPGIGLGIVQEVADVHGWEIGIDESDDGGARFEITGIAVGSPDGTE